MNPILLTLLTAVVSWLSACPAHGASPSEKAPLYLSQGEQRLLHIPGLVRYSLGGDAIRAQAVPSSKKGGHPAAPPPPPAEDLLLLKGVHPGPSDLWVWRSDGNSEHRMIQVDKRPMPGFSAPLTKALEPLSEAEILYSAAGVVLRGEIQSFEEAARIDHLVRGFPKEVHDETEPAESLLTEAQKRLEAWLKKSHYASKLRIVREDKLIRVLLSQGSLDGPLERSNLEKRIRSLYPLAQVELEALPDSAPTVHFKVFLLELKKSKFHSLGLGWPGAQESAFRVSTSAIQDLVSLDVALQILEGEGSVKILSNPELVVRAPGEAELFSGGEIPIQTRSAYFSAVTWKSFGLMLKLNVTHSAGDRVRLDIMTEVSHLDPTLTTEKVPGLQANRMKTQVDARYGKPLLLSGLLQQNLRKQAKGLPFLRDIPILGALFGSEDYLNERSELVAILVPSAELPANPMERITRLFPKGALPPAREPANPEEERAATRSSDYPWNVLQ